MSTFSQDLRHGARTLLANPTFTSVAVLALALGIGATTIVFTLVDAVLLRPLPYDRPDRLVAINEMHPRVGRFSVAPGNFVSWQAGTKAFEAMSLYGGASLILTGEGEPEELRGAAVSADLFATLGLRPLLGRTFLPEEDEPGRDDVVILSQALWQTRFGGSADVLGRRLLLGGRARTVVGVMPRGFELLRPDVTAWIPLALGTADRQNTSRTLSGPSAVSATGRQWSRRVRSSAQSRGGSSRRSPRATRTGRWKPGR